MNINKIEVNGVAIAVVKGSEELIVDTQSALDFITNVKYKTQSTRIIIDKRAVCEDFFNLSSGIAGEILQKMINYQVKIAIYGDYSKYTSAALKDFIYECNNGRDIFFVGSEEEALKKLAV